MTLPKTFPLAAGAATRPAASAVGPWRMLGRLTGMTVTCVGHGGRWACRRLLVRGGPANRRRLAGDTLARLFEDLGPTFVKVGQVLSCRPDLVSEEVGLALRRLRDRTAPLDGRRMLGRLERQLGVPLDELFEQVEDEPVASASIAQVHRGRLRDGRWVAVKIRRPGIVRRVAEDLALLRAGARLLERLPGLSRVPLAALVDEIGEAVTQQLDFRREAANNRRFHRNLGGRERLRLPALVEPLCGDAVLTMDFLDGLIAVDDAATLDAAARQSAAVLGLRTLYQMIFRDGFVHADLHPGNLFLRQWGEVALLDLGLVADLDEGTRQAFVDFFLGMVVDDGLACARVVHDTALSVPADLDRRAFDDAFVELIGHHSQLKAEDFEVTAFAVQLFDLQRRFGVRGTTSFTMVILSLMVYEGIVKRLHPELDFQREARGFLIAAKYGRAAAARSEKPATAGPC